MRLEISLFYCNMLIQFIINKNKPANVIFRFMYIIFIIKSSRVWFKKLNLKMMDDSLTHLYYSECRVIQVVLF